MWVLTKCCTFERGKRFGTARDCGFSGHVIVVDLDICDRTWISILSFSSSANVIVTALQQTKRVSGWKLGLVQRE